MVPGKIAETGCQFLCWWTGRRIQRPLPGKFLVEFSVMDLGNNNASFVDSALTRHGDHQEYRADSILAVRCMAMQERGRVVHRLVFLVFCRASYKSSDGEKH